MKQLFTFYVMRALILVLMLLPSLQIAAQFSPSGQTRIVTPALLSACSADTIELQFTNTDGPFCGLPGAQEYVQYEIKIPDTNRISFLDGVLFSEPSGATEVSNVNGVLTLSVPVPTFGTTITTKFAVTTSCDVTAIDMLPSFDVTATYPGTFPITSEMWSSSRMNVGVGYLSHTTSSNTLAQTFVVPIGSNHQPFAYIRNTGFGDIKGLKYYQIVDDSIKFRYNDKPYMWIRDVTNGSVVLFSGNIDVFPDYLVTPLGDGTTLYEATIPLDKFTADGSFDAGDYSQFYNYFTMPDSCINDLVRKSWFEVVCADDGPSCQDIDTVYQTYRITAGTPVVAGVEAAVDVWDGTGNKNLSFVYRNNGAGDASRPEVGTAYDLTLQISFKGLLEIDSLIIGGNSAWPGAPAMPFLGTGFTLPIKDLLTTDPDGPGGIEDLDGDGFFDDLGVGDSIPFSFIYSVPIPEASGTKLDYDIDAISSFTDFCRKLNGKQTSNLYEFGFKQNQPIAQDKPLADMGTLANSQVATVSSCFSFQYTETNISLDSASMQLVLNYGPSEEIFGDVTFLGNTLDVGTDFSVLGTGFTPPNSAHVPSAADASTNTVDSDSALVYDLTMAEMTAVLDATGDELCYSMARIGCDSFQKLQSNSAKWSLLFYYGPNADPIDLTGGAGYSYNFSQGCGGTTCYELDGYVYREANVGYDNEEEDNLVAVQQDSANFYAGDTLVYLSQFALRNDLPAMEDIGEPMVDTRRIRPMRQTFSVSWDFEDLDYTLEEGMPIDFVPGTSRLIVRDTSTGTLIADLPIAFENFWNWSENAMPTTDGRNFIVADNITHSDTYAAAPDNNSVPGNGLGDWWCYNSSLPIDPASCPYADTRYRPADYLNETVVHMMVNDAGNRATAYLHLALEEILVANGITFSPGSTDILWEVATRWKVREDYDHTNTSDIRFGYYVYRYGNDVGQSSGGTRVGSCNNHYALGTIISKEFGVEGGNANYSADCGLTVHNKLRFDNFSGDFFTNEVRVPYKLDSITIDLPTEYTIAATPAINLAGSNGGPANSIQASGLAGHVVFTHDMVATGLPYADFPRFSDADGNTTVWDLSYLLVNSVPNASVDVYRVPVKYSYRDENNEVYTVIDSFTISEAEPEVEVSVLGGIGKIADGDSCSLAYVDVIIANNTLYGAANVFIAAQGTANTDIAFFEDITGPGISEGADPIDTASDLYEYGTGGLYAELGAMVPAEQRYVRIYFYSNVCSDAFWLYGNFGCAYPSTQQPEYPSNTLDSVLVMYESLQPNMMSSPLDGNKYIESLCDTVELEIEVRNVTTVNIDELLGTITLPAGAAYVAGSADISTLNSGGNLIYQDATAVTYDAGANELEYDLSQEYPWSEPCGLAGSDEGNSAIIKMKFDIVFTACPTTTVDEVFYVVEGENYCGESTKTSGIFNLIYVGDAGEPNEYDAASASTEDIEICGGAGDIVPIVDTLIIENISGPATSGKDTAYLTIASDVSLYTISNLTFAAPWTATSTTLNADGFWDVTFLVPSGIDPAGTSSMIINYDLEILDDDHCSISGMNSECQSVAYNISFFSPINIGCDPTLVCGSLGVESRGTGAGGKNFKCCPQYLGNYVWLDVNNDGIQNTNEMGIEGIEVILVDNGPDGIANTGDDIYLDTMLTDANGNYLFEVVDAAGDYAVFFGMPVGSNYLNTPSIGGGDNYDDTNSDRDTITGFTGTINLIPGESDTTIDAGFGLIPVIAINDTFGLIPGGAVLNGSVLDNDSDPNDDPIGSVTVLEGPPNGTVVMDSTDGTFTYVPNPGFSGLDTFVYIYCDAGVPVACDTATVYITVEPPMPDTIVVTQECSSCPVTACPTGDDVDLFYDNITYQDCGAPGGYTMEVDTLTGCVEYTPTMTNTDTSTMTCVVICANGVCDTTFVLIVPLIPEPDTVTVMPACPTCPVTACATLDDVDPNNGPTTYMSCGAPMGYTEMLDPLTGCITYTPTTENMDTVMGCIQICVNGVCDTTYVLIPPPPIMPDTVVVTLPCPNCPITACPTGDDVNMNNGGVTYQSCGTPAGYSEIVDPFTGCSTYTPMMTITDTTYDCIAVCVNGICDTTYVVIIPVQPVTDTIVIEPECVTCTVTACPTGDDLNDFVGPSTSMSCGVPMGYSEQIDPFTGCVRYTPITLQTDTVYGCIMTCINGVCDTTIVVIPPKPFGPDTLTVTMACANCPVNACPSGDDLNTNMGTVTYGLCGTPANFTEVQDPSTGCVVYTPTMTITDTTFYGCTYVCVDGICDTTYVVIIPPSVSVDTIIVEPACANCPVEACATADDLDTTLGMVSTSSCGAPMGYTEVVDSSTGCITYVPDMLTGDTVYSCIAICVDGFCDTTYVIIPPAPVVPDTVEVVPPCVTCPVETCVNGDDVVDTVGEVTYSSCGVPNGYTEVLDPETGCVEYTPTMMQTDTVVGCVLECANGVCDTIYVIIPPKPFEPDTIIVVPDCITCPVIACQTGDDLDTSMGVVTTGLCGDDGLYTASIDPTTGCAVYTPIGHVMDTSINCTYICVDGVCDTTYVIIPPKPFGPDTVYVTPDCITCPVTECVTGDDVDVSMGMVVYALCGNPDGFSTSLNITDGCVTYTPDSVIVDTTIGCVLVCVDGICDTTYIIIEPLVITPDTVTEYLPCPNCPVTACVTGDDLDLTMGTVTYSVCGSTATYDEVFDSATGCVEYTPMMIETDTSYACIVACVDGLCDTTYVIIIPVQPVTDTVYVVPDCITCPVEACATGDDVDDNEGTLSWESCGAPDGFTEVVDPTTGCVEYTPTMVQTDTVFGCIIECANGVCDTTIVIIPPKVFGPDTVVVEPDCITCPVEVCPTGDDVDTSMGMVTTGVCGDPMGYTSSIDPVTGCIIYTPTMHVMDTTYGCTYICVDGVCDTTYVIIPPKVFGPDTIYVTPACSTCDVEACVTGDDVDVSMGFVTYASCGVPDGYTLDMFDTNTGCATYTPDSVNTDTVIGCLVVCVDFVCDTTYVIIPPYLITPDTITDIVAPGTVTTYCPDTTQLMGEITSVMFCSMPDSGSVAMAASDELCADYTAPSELINPVTDTFCMIVCDTFGECDTTTFIIRVDPVLSVQAMELAAQKDASGTEAILLWTTENEEGTAYFEIERATDGVNFSTLDEASSKGDGAHSYSYVDRSPESTNFYRIKQVDREGNITYSSIRNLNFEFLGQAKVYPNPFRTELQVDVTSNMLGSSYELMDVTGRVLRTGELDQNNTTIDLAELKPAIYLLRIYDAQSEQLIQTERVIKM